MAAYRKRRTKEKYLLGFASFTVLTLMAVVIGYSGRAVPKETDAEYSLLERDLNCDLPAESQPTNCQFEDSRKKLELTKKKKQETLRSTMKKDFIILVMSTDGRESNLKRTVGALKRMASDIPIVVSLPDYNPDLQKTLSSRSIYFVDEIPYFSFLFPFASYAQKAFSALGNLPGSQFLGWSKRKNVCFEPKPKKNSISLLKTSKNGTQIVSYEFSAKDELSQREITFGDSKFNPHQQKILAAKDAEYKRTYIANTSEPVENSKTSSIHGKCREARRLRDSFVYLQQRFSSFKHVIVVDPRKHFSPTLISFFVNTSKIFDFDHSVYCVSAHNPLQIKGSTPPDEKLLRVDHFVYGGATLLAKKLVDEIITHFQLPLYPDEKRSLALHDYDPMEKDLTDWLSWISRRRLRGCVIPAKPRVCSHPSECSVVIKNTFNLEKVMKYVYFTQTFNNTKDLTPLRYMSLPCKTNIKPPFRRNEGRKSFGIYMKMLATDDDLSLRIVFKCFGLNPKAYLGGFEALHQLYWGNDVVYVIGVPYSRFSPSIVKGSRIYIADFGSMETEILATIHKSKDFEGRRFNITTVPYSFNENDNATEFEEEETIIN